jgi:Ribosome inactivating protein
MYAYWRTHVRLYGVFSMADFTISLQKHQYQSSLGALRNYLTNSRVGFLDIEVTLPNGETSIHLQLRCSDVYVIGFKGADGWYHFDNEAGGWGSGCGVGSNYNVLANVQQMTVGSVNNLASLARFKAGSPLDTKLIVTAAAVISESLRFATVTTYFTGLFNGFYKDFSLNQVVPSDQLKRKYFLNWDDLSKKNASEVLLKK